MTTLYERLGGAAGIAALVEDVIASHLRNPLVSPRFQAIKDLDHTKRSRAKSFGFERTEAKGP